MDYLAGLLELVGLVIIGNKSRLGFLVNMLGNLLWTFVAIRTHLYGLLLVVIPAFFINLRNFIKWRKAKT